MMKSMTTPYQMEPLSTTYSRSGAHLSETHCRNRDLDTYVLAECLSIEGFSLMHSQYKIIYCVHGAYKVSTLSNSSSITANNDVADN